MSYKLLCHLLPVDIVNKVVEYSACYNINKIHMNKIYNIAKIRLIMFNNTKETINKFKKYNYPELYFSSDHLKNNDYITKIEKIVGIVPKILTNNVLIYIRNNRKKCGWDCAGCDFSDCKDDEIFDKC